MTAAREIPAERCFSVSGLTLLLRSLIDELPILHRIWVRGETSNFTAHSSGHFYFTLKDPQARLRCVMFRTHAGRLRFKPENGMEVLAFGSIGIYERGGEYQLYVESVEPAGMGALHLAFLQLYERLAAEGLFDRERKRPLPPMPRRIALVTSPNGAAVHDMIAILRQRQPSVDILVIPVAVQGPEAAPSIARGLAAASDLADLDLVITGRGGGSPEELWPFNEEAVARAIRACRHPVIAAVGHEVDVTIADYAADARAATPTAAAEMAVPDGRILREKSAGLSRRLSAAIRRRLVLERATISRLAASPVLLKPERILAGARQGIDEAWAALLRVGRDGLVRRRERLALAAGKLESISPLATLARGYAVCLDMDGRVVIGADMVNTGDEVAVLLHRGRLHCLVRQKEDRHDRGKRGQENL